MITKIEDSALNSFADKIADQYDVDFRDYASASFRRRVTALLLTEQLKSLTELESRILDDPAAFQRFVHAITVNVTSMFRDPSFYLEFRKHVVPRLRTYPFIRIWNAGCSTGEEAYSIAILLQEEGIYDRVRIYATDIDAISIKSAKDGIYSLAHMKDYSINYLKAGGKETLARFYTADHEYALLKSQLKTNIVFARHNLVSDKSFNEFHVIMCRNVLIYFNDELRQRVLTLFSDSLSAFGYLGLGSKESLRFSQVCSCFEQVGSEKIYRKIS